jgi:hypothetical protein
MVSERLAGFASDRSIVGAIAEFTALRSLMAVRFQLQVAIVSLGVTAVGLVAGLAYRSVSDRGLLLLVPLIGSVTAALYCEQWARLRTAGFYIRDALWPYVQEISDPRMPSYEMFWDQAAAKGVAHLGTIAPPVLLVGLGWLALAESAHSAVSSGSASMGVAWLAGLVLTAIALTYAFTVARMRSPLRPIPRSS